MARFCQILLIVSLVSYTDATESKATPLTKVIEMLEGMIKKGKEEKMEEYKEWKKTGLWCKRVEDEIAYTISREKARIAELKMIIDQAIAEIQKLGLDISELDYGAAGFEKQLANQTKHRKKEHNDFVEADHDLQASMAAADRALQEIKSGSISQVTESMLQQAQKSFSFMQLSSDDEDSLASPAISGYEHSGDSVINMLHDLKKQFKAERSKLEMTEVAARRNNEAIVQQLTTAIAAAHRYEKAKRTLKAAQAETKSDTEEEERVEEVAESEDSKNLDLTFRECKQKQAEFKKNQDIREEELEAIEKALDIISSDKVKGNAGKHLARDVQKTMLAQLRSTNDQELRTRLVALLQSRAESGDSKYLSLAAARAVSDPLGKVKKMIEDMIQKLMDQASDESEHKEYCDKELSTNQQTREDLSSTVEQLTAKVNEQEADSAQLQMDMKELTAAVADIKSNQADATAMRSEEKVTNTETIRDAKEAQIAVEQAIHVLQDYYSKSDSGSSLLQGSDALGDEMNKASSQAPYQGMALEGGGVVNFLQIILSDFARLESETSAAEDVDQTEFEKYMEESTTDAQQKDKEARHKARTKMHLDESTVELRKELDNTQEELSAANDYYDKLKPDCVDKGLSYKERVAARKAEIESLSDALRVFESM